MEDDNVVVFCKNLDSLQKIVRMKQRLRRPISRSTLEIAPGMKIGIGFYSFVRLVIVYHICLRPVWCYATCLLVDLSWRISGRRSHLELSTSTNEIMSVLKEP